MSSNVEDKLNGSFRSSQPIIPMTRVRTIMKSSPEITMISQDTLYLVCKATELFIKTFSKEAFKRDKIQSNELDYKMLSDLVQVDDKFQFLSEIIPQKIKAKDALKEIEQEALKSMK